MNMRYFKGNILNGLIWFSTIISLSVLVIIIGFIFVKGFSYVDWTYITSDYESDTQYVMLEKSDTNLDYSGAGDNEIYLPEYGIAIEEAYDEHENIYYAVSYIHSDSHANYTSNIGGESYPIEVGFQLTKIGSTDINKIESLEQIQELMLAENPIRLRIVKPGGGIWPMIVSTLMLIGLSLVIAIPIGVFAAIYLVEYAKPGRLVNIIRFATESLAGIPSIVYGLFGMIFFVKMMGVGKSVLAGALTLSIILLPTIIRTTEETLKTVPSSYKEASLGLGANRLQTLWKVILPSAIPGILVAVILSIGRIVGESAALLFTMGGYAQMPTSIRDQGATLTVRAYMEVKESGNVEMAAGIGVVLMIIVLVLNISARTVSNILAKD